MHTAKAIVVRCMDFRTITSLHDHLISLGLKDQYDLVSIAGAAKNLVDPVEPTDPQFFLRQISIAQSLHQVTQVILINHMDCGAYGSVKFANKEEERKRHESDLKKAKEIIERHFPGITVKTVLANFVPATVVQAEHLDSEI